MAPEPPMHIVQNPVAPFCTKSAKFERLKCKILDQSIKAARLGKQKKNEVDAAKWNKIMLIVAITTMIISMCSSSLFIASLSTPTYPAEMTQNCSGTPTNDDYITFKTDRDNTYRLVKQPNNETIKVVHPTVSYKYSFTVGSTVQCSATVPEVREEMFLLFQTAQMIREKLHLNEQYPELITFAIIMHGIPYIMKASITLLMIFDLQNKKGTYWLMPWITVTMLDVVSTTGFFLFSLLAFVNNVLLLARLMCFGSYITIAVVGAYVGFMHIRFLDSQKTKCSRKAKLPAAAIQNI